MTSRKTIGIINKGVALKQKKFDIINIILNPVPFERESYFLKEIKEKNYVRPVDQ